MKSYFVRVSGRDIHVVEKGSGPTVILIHGWLCWGRFWKKNIPELAKHFRIIAPDLPGHGLSAKEGIEFTTDAQVDFIAALCDTLDIKRFSVAGHSMGGEIAAKVAIQYPERVRHLALICAAGLSDGPNHLPFYVRLSRRLELERLLGKLFGETMIRTFARSLMFHPQSAMPDELVRDIIAANLRTLKDRDAMVRVTRTGLFRDFINNRCTEIIAPTLVISGLADKVVSPQIGYQYEKLIPSAEHLVFARSGHMVPWEEPEALSAALIEHFTRRV